MSSKNFMIDIESMGTSSNAAIVSIGAVGFDPDTGQLGGCFEVNVDLASCQKSGLVIDADTLKWWMGQGSEAKDTLFPKNADHLYGALSKLTSFIKEESKGCRGAVVWSCGSNFDIVLLESAYRACDLKEPWQYYNVRDVRTIMDLAKPAMSRDDFPFKGVKHSALADAKHQAEYVSAMWQTLRSGLKTPLSGEPSGSA